MLRCGKRRLGTLFCRLLASVAVVLLFIGALNIGSVCRSPDDVAVRGRNILPAVDQQGGSKDLGMAADTSLDLEPLTYNAPLTRIPDVSRVLVVVVMCGCNIEKIRLISRTWRYDVSRVVFVAPFRCTDNQAFHNHEVFHLPSNDLSPSLQTIKTLEYLYRHHMGSYSWFAVVSSETYVNGQMLGLYLSKIDSEEAVYLGKPPVNGAEDKERLKLVPHEGICVGGAGMVLSRAAVSKLVPVIGNHGRLPVTDIKSLVEQHLKQHSVDGDLFREDFQQLYMNPDRLWSKDQYADLLTVYPAILPEHMLTLHLLYRTLEYEQLRNRITTVGETLNRLHLQLSTTISPEHIQPHNYYNAPEINPRKLTAGNLPSWSVYENGNLYNDRSIEPRHNVKYEKVEDMKEIELLKPWIEKVASKDYGSWLKLRNIEYHYVLRHGLKGNEYMIDALFRPVNEFRKVVKRRVRLSRPLAKEIVVKPSKSDDSETIHIVIPLGNVSDRFRGFLDSHQRELLIRNENVHLVLAVYGEEDINFTKQATKEILDRFPRARITVVPGQGQFTRARAFEIAMSVLHDNDLVFLCDVDLNIKPSFLQRCRRSAIQGKMVYFPEMFKLYNMKYAYRGRRPPKKIELNRKHGFWEYYSYGMACMYKSDYSTMDQSIVGWGGEDVDFIVKTLKKKIEVFRAPDTGLIHRWHSNPCKTRDADSHFHCVYSAMRTYADRNDLATYMLELEEKLREKESQL